MTVSEFAAHIGVSRNTLSRILNERAAITAEMSMRLSEAFGQPTSDIWFRMQNKYDFWQARHVRRAKIRPVSPQADDLAGSGVTVCTAKCCFVST